VRGEVRTVSVANSKLNWTEKETYNFSHGHKVKLCS